MIENLDQLGLGLLFTLGVAYSILQFAHFVTFPIGEDRMRRIIREEVKKILVDIGQ